jgi:hypothetical protein
VVFFLEVPNVESWFDLTTEVFQAHRSTKVEILAKSIASVASVASPNNFDDFKLIHSPPAPPTATKMLDLAMEFAKGTNRSFNNLKHFKEASQWNSWHCHLISTTRAQGSACIYDLSYTPANIAKEKLYKLQNEFAFSCLELAIHTADGKMFLLEFQDSGDARAVYYCMDATMRGRLENSKPNALKVSSTRCDSRSGTRVANIS